MITLNEDQETGLAHLLAFYNSTPKPLTPLPQIPDAKSFVLSGSAGTGKSTTIQYLVKRLPYARVAFTAPTNKAVKVLARMRKQYLKRHPEEQHRTIVVSTIHKLLGLTIKYEKDQQVLVQDGHSQAHAYDLIIIDEGSMINKELLGFIESELKFHTHLKVIYMADFYQWNPINEVISETFRYSQSFNLTKVERQADDNPVLGLCTGLRDLIAPSLAFNKVIEPMRMSEDISTPIKSQLSNLIKPVKHGKAGVHVVSANTFESMIYDAFSLKNYNFDSIDRFRVIAWTNKVVNKWNKRIQHHRYPDLGDLPFAVGEPCVFSQPLLYASTVFDKSQMYPTTKENGTFAMYIREAFRESDEPNWKTVLLPTETEGIIESVEKLDDFIFQPLSSHLKYSQGFEPVVLPIYKVTVQVDEVLRYSTSDSDHDYSSIGNSIVTCIVPEDRDALDKLYKRMVKMIRDNGEFSLAWKDFWITKAIFADLRPVYALTSHKSQGSTFNHVFIEYGDIMSNFNQEEALKALYVAVSRVGTYGNAVIRG